MRKDEPFRQTSLTILRGTPRHDFSFLWFRLMEITNCRLIPSYISRLMKKNKCAISAVASSLITSRLSDLGSLLISKQLHNTKQLKCGNDEEKWNTWFKSRSFYGRTKRNLCVAVIIKIYGRICIYVMTRPPSPVGLVRAAMAADFSADVAAAAGRLVVEAAAAQQVRCSRLRPVVAKQLALSLKSDNDKSWLMLRFPSKSPDLITNATQHQKRLY